MNNDVYDENSEFDLRSALNILNHESGNIEIVDEPLKSDLEVASYFYHNGAGTPSPNSFTTNPTVFTNVDNCSIPVVMGLFNHRKQCAQLLGFDEETIARDLSRHINRDYPMEIVSNPLCQEHVITDNIEIGKILPVLKFTKDDANPYINMGLVYAEDPETKESDVTIHRLCLQEKNKMTIYMIKDRHIEIFYQKAKKRNQPLPITINIGMDPAIYFSSLFTYPNTPLGFNEMNIAGSIRKKGVKIANAVSNNSKVIANAEIVLEGYILPDEMPENPNDPNGNSLPEFLGYIGSAQKSLPIVEITAITFRNNPIYQTIIGPGSELSNICGLATEASIYKTIKETVTNKILNCYCSSVGGGKLVAFLQFKKTDVMDDVIVRQAGITAFSAFHELKHVYLVDEDINVFDEKDILWAMTTRFQGEKSIISIPNLACHPLDPSQDPEFEPTLSHVGTTYKTVFDCTKPFAMRDKFKRVSY